MEFTITIESEIVSVLGADKVEAFLQHAATRLKLKVATQEALADLDYFDELVNDPQWQTARHQAWDQEKDRYLPFAANMLMAILIGGRAFHKVILQTFTIITPDFALVEIDKYHQIITKKSALNWSEHVQYAQTIFSHVTVIPRYLIESETFAKANQLIGDTDPKDVIYLALAIQSDSILITRDKPIIESARRKGFRRILTYDEFLRKYS